MMTWRTARLPRWQRGATLIEVLVALLVLAIGLLGTAALQTRAQTAEVEAYQRSQALLLAQDMVSRLNTNRRTAPCYDTFASGGTNFVGEDGDVHSCQGFGTSSTRARADADLAEWHSFLVGEAERRGDEVVGAMAGARGCIEFDGAAEVYTVTVAWQGHASTEAPEGNDCAAGEYGDEEQRRIVEMRLRMGDLG